MSFTFARDKRQKNHGYFFLGFTLIELMVTIAIFVFMTALAMARYNNYYSGTLFKNLAYDVAITIRQAQSYGISVKVDEQNSSFDRAYGVFFSNDDPSKFSLQSYNTFSYYNNSTDEKTYNLKHGATFSSLQVSTDGSSYNTVYDLSIIFQRPNPEAIICATINSVNTCGYKYARITLKAVDGVTIRIVKVNASGQISIEQEIN